MSSTLLHQIQNEAVDAHHDLTSLLRKCRILAQRLNNTDLKHWVNNELDGYRSNDELPIYRILRSCPMLGDYYGFGGSGATNVAIPPTSIDEAIRNSIVPVRFHQGIMELDTLTTSSREGFLNLTVPPEAFMFIKHPQMRGDMVLCSVSKVVNTAFIKGIFDTVRNRILNFTLELESEGSNAGDPLESLRIGKSDVIQHIFNTEIRGNVSNLAQGSSQFSQNVNVPKGDVEAFISSLQPIGLTEGEINELVETIQQETPDEKGAFGKGASGLMGKVFSKAAEGLLKVPGSVAGNLLTEALKGYYGL